MTLNAPLNFFIYRVAKRLKFAGLAVAMAAVAALPAVAANAPATFFSGADVSGLISVEDFYSTDSTGSYDRNILTARLRLDVLKLGKSERIGLHFDGRERMNLGQSDYSSSIANERVDIMNADYTTETLYLAVGRLWPKEMPIERVDGINAVVKKGNHGFGLFGGYNPNPYTEAFTTEYTTAGAYYFYQKDELGARLGFMHKGFKGRTDRQYIYGEATYFPANGFSLYSSATVDIAQDIGAIKLTNGIVELTYRPDHTKSITFGYNQFRSFKLYESMDYAVDDSRQDAYYVSANYRLYDKYTLYGRVERQSRYYPDIDAALENAMIYGAGINAVNLMGTGFNMDANVTLSDSYGSLHNTYSLQVDRLFVQTLQVITHISYTANEYGTDNNDNIWAYGAAGYLYLGDWSLSLALDAEQGSYYSSKRAITRASYKF